MTYKVAKYIPQSLYGFLDGNGQSLFFHLSSFKPYHAETVPPIAGETVDVTLTPEGKVKEIHRTGLPLPLEGVVVTFDQKMGFGFLRSEDNLLFFLHRSEIVDGRLPRPQQRVRFYSGSRDGKLRACYVEILNG